LIICSRNPDLLKQCLDAVERTTSHNQREVVIVRHETGDPTVWRDHRFPGQPVWAPYRGPFNFSRMNNLGARHAAGEVLVFLNDDVTPLVPDWLSGLIAQALRPEIGVAGAKLLYPSGAIQHVGIVLGMLHGIGHLHRDTFGAEDWNWLPFTRNVSAVTGACMAIRQSVFSSIGGFDEDFPVNYNDVDLCLRARHAGYQVVIEPHALLRHSECASRLPGIGIEERDLWEERWAVLLRRPDPYYNPNLSATREQAILDPEEGPGDLTPR
jgi:GT2 family glycosyltransferase